MRELSTPEPKPEDHSRAAGEPGAAPTPVAETSPPKVLYIIASHRSGSTLLGNLLGELPDFVSVGELRFLFEAAAGGGDHPCGCGTPVRECAVWAPVLGHLVNGGFDPLEVHALQRRSFPVRHAWRHLPQLLRKRTEASVVSYGRALEALYRAVVDVTGARVVVDASKEVTDAAVVARATGLRATFIHIVRDPRGVVLSARERTDARFREERARLERPDPLLSAKVTGSWAIDQLASGLLLSRLTTPSIRLRYEDVVRRPEATLRQVAACLGEPWPGSPVEPDGFVDFSVNHTVSGNSSRFRRGMTEVREDNRWRRQLPPLDRRVTTALALPLLARFGYLRRPP